MVLSVGLSATDVVGNVFDDNVGDWMDCEFLEEFVVIDGVECFAHVKRYCDCALWGSSLVEACCDVVCDEVECCRGGVFCSKAVLVAGCCDVLCDEW